MGDTAQTDPTRRYQPVTEAISHRWTSIEGLPEDVSSLTNPDLATLASSWRAQQSAMRGTSDLADFEDHLRVEWAVETGVVERLYSLPRSVTDLLTLASVAPRVFAEAGVKDPEVVAGMVRDHLVALERVTEMAADERGMSPGDIKELHALITLHLSGNGTPLLKGAYKREPNDVTRQDGSSHQFAPPSEVAVEMERLLELHEKHEAREVPPEAQACLLYTSPSPRD